MPGDPIEKTTVERLAERFGENGVYRQDLVSPQSIPVVQSTKRESVAEIPIGKECRPAGEIAKIDTKRLQKAGMVTPSGGRGRVVDEYRSIKRPILLNSTTGRDALEKHRNLVMISSARAGEGKTFTSISLAMSVASELDTQVLLVDLDLAKQSLCRTLGIKRETGLTDLLQNDQLVLEDVIVETDIPRLKVLPGGPDHPLATELLAGVRMRELINDLVNRYRGGLVIFDTAPLLVSTDPSLLSSHVGQTILVVEANRTTKSAVEEALSVVSGCELIYLVLNQATVSEMMDYYGSYYGCES